jgi:predicted DNA-binding transcriptional regulator AlpA
VAERLWTAEQVAEFLGVSVGWVYEQSRKDAIPTVTLGRNRRDRPEAIRAWAAEIEHGGPNAPRTTGARASLGGRLQRF